MAKVHISIPVSEGQREMLVQLAAENGMSLSAFCRDRIMAKEQLTDAFSTLQKTVMASIDAAVVQRQPMPNGHGENNNAMLAEVLLLLRSMVPPQKMMAVHSELKRRGMTPFSE